MKPASINIADRSTWPEVLTREEVAAIFRAESRPTFDRRRKSGEVPPPMGDSGLLWSKAVVIKWIDKPSERPGFRKFMRAS